MDKLFMSKKYSNKQIEELSSLYIKDGFIEKNRFGKDKIPFSEMSPEEYWNIFDNHIVVMENCIGIKVFYRGKEVYCEKYLGDDKNGSKKKCSM